MARWVVASAFRRILPIRLKPDQYTYRVSGSDVAGDCRERGKLLVYLKFRAKLPSHYIRFVLADMGCDSCDWSTGRAAADHTGSPAEAGAHSRQLCLPSDHQS